MKINTIVVCAVLIFWYYSILVICVLCLGVLSERSASRASSGSARISSARARLEY
jgi:hypothetical protein